jgi:hypothetical protein
MTADIPESVLAHIRMRARSGVTEGRDRLPHERAYYRRCTHLHWQTGSVVMFTRDTGHHSSGWMKNPDYERCWHLSLSFREPKPERPAEELADPNRLARLGAYFPLAPFDFDVARLWVKYLHGDGARYVWEEGPFSGAGKTLGVRHYRVFCDLGWQPIKPRGEVYSRELTEKGWRSWSDQHAEPNWVSAE